MAIQPYSYRSGEPDSFEYLEAGALGETVVGQALIVTDGKLAKASGATRPEYIGMYQGKVADGQVIPVIRVHGDTRYVADAAEAFDAVIGAKYTLNDDGTKITSATGGAAEMVRFGGGEYVVRFPEA